jgi:hypothetical protein
MERLRGRPINSKSTVVDKLHCGGAVQEAHFAVRRKAYPLYELRSFKSLVTLKIEAICSSETTVLTRATLHKIPKDIYNRKYNVSENEFLSEECRMPFSGILRRVALVRTDVSKELSASFIRVTRIG